jgi:hypothetical protein
MKTNIRYLLQINTPPLISFAVSRLIIIIFSFIIVYLAPKILPYTNFANFHFPPFLEMWTIFDGNVYIKMARTGYTHYAWFPLYPLAIKILHFFIPNYVLSGLIISNVAFLLGLCFFYNLVKSEINTESAKRAVWYLSLYPFSYFFSCAYAESLFFLFVIQTFYYIKKAKWPFAGLFAMFAGLTRIIGITLYPSLLYSYIENRRKKSQKILNLDILKISLLPIAILILVIFFYIKTNNPIIFITTQSAWGRHFNLPTAAILNGFNKLFYFFADYNYTLSSLKGFIIFFLNAIWKSVDVVTLLISFFLVKGVFKNFNNSYKIFAIFYLFFALSSQILTGLPRHVMILFPFFMYLGILGKNKIFNFIVIFLFIVFSFVFLIAWLQHLYIA